MSDSVVPPAYLLSWAKPVANGTFLIEQGTHSWAKVHWLSQEVALVGYRTRNDFVGWERLNIRTGQRHRETAFGSPLAWHHYERRDGSFSVAAASQDGRRLLGFRDRQSSEDSVYSVVSQGGREQKWSVENYSDFATMVWLPDSSGWFSPWKSGDDRTTTLWRFRLGERHPQPCRLRGLPLITPETDAIRQVLGTMPSGEALLAYGQITNDIKNVAASLYAVRVEEGAHARKLSTLRLPAPSIFTSLGTYEALSYSSVHVSPEGDRLLLECEQGSDDLGYTTSLYVCGLNGKNFRKIGHIPVHKPTPGQWDGISLRGLCWHPDSRHVSFFYGNLDGYRLFIAAVPP